MGTTGTLWLVSVGCLVTMISLQIKFAHTACTDTQAEVIFANETDITCCETCTAGYGVRVKCSTKENTECEPCISGKTYSNEIKHTNSCKKCSTCGDNTHFILHPCNVTHDTVCGCPSGSYYDSEADQCKFCDLCPAEWGASRKCNKHQNTICNQCEPNVTFSNKLDYFSPCMNCSKCSETEVMLQSCAKGDDTICLSVNVGNRFPDYNYTKPTYYDDDDDDDGDIIPVYCAVLGLVVVGLLGYVIFKHWRRLRAKRCHHKTPSAHEDVEYSKASGADSGVFVESESPKSYTYCLASRVRDIPQGKRKELEKILSSPQSDGWKALAKELGYNNRRLGEFETRGRNDHNSSFKHMLHDWERRDIAIVNHLIQCLRNIHRDDAARILYLDSTEGRTQMFSKQSNVV